MLHKFVFRSRNWQGVVLLIQSPLSRSFFNHFFFMSSTGICKWLAILLMSLFVYVGVITLQQLAQEIQFTSSHTWLPAFIAVCWKLRGGLLSIPFNNFKKDFRRFLRRCFNFRSVNDSIKGGEDRRKTLPNWLACYFCSKINHQWELFYYSPFQLYFLPRVVTQAQLQKCFAILLVKKIRSSL